MHVQEYGNCRKDGVQLNLTKRDGLGQTEILMLHVPKYFVPAFLLVRKYWVEFLEFEQVRL